MTPSVRRVARLYVYTLVALGIMLLAVWYSGYSARKAGCERAKVDRTANADGWRTAEAARRASGTSSDIVAADRYQRVAESLEARSRISCGHVL